MLYLVAFFLPPLALLLVGKPFQAVISLVLYLLAWVGLFFFLIPGFLCWVVAVAHAILVINGKRADQRAEKIARAVRQN